MFSMDDLHQISVGALLRNRRTELGLSLADIAARTNIRSAYLEALEEGRYEVLPGVAYQVGFLRNYASFLGLETDRVLQQWRKETVTTDSGKQGEPATVSPEFREAAASRRSPWLAVILVLLLLVPVIAYFVFHVHPPAPSLPVAASVVHVPEKAGDATVSSATADSPLSPVVTAAETEAEGAMTSGPDSVPADLHAIPAEGGVVRLEALGPLTLEVEVDSRPLRRYVLNTASALQWDVTRNARLAVDDPSAVKIWFGDAPLDLAGRSEIFLQAATAE